MQDARGEAYPDELDGVRLHKSATTASGYTGVSIVRAGGFAARLGSRNLGVFSHRVDAALAFSRAKEQQREEHHHQRNDARRWTTKRQKKSGGRSLPVKPEASGSAASTHYGSEEAARYTSANACLQRELAARCVELLGLKPRRRHLLLDLGCGSGLSSRVLGDEGHEWLGLDIAREMLALAAGGATSARAALVHADLSRGVPLRAGCRFDGAICVSTLQWLCEPQARAGGESDGDDAVRAVLRLFFDSLRAALHVDASAVFQFYPTAEQAVVARQVASGCGFDAALLTDMPHASRSRKLFLCTRHSAAGVAADAAGAEAVAACCPLAWPHRAQCVCSSRWFGAQPRPACYPRAMAAGCCRLREQSGSGGAARADEPAGWMARLYQSCRCVSVGPGSDGATRGNEVSASVERQQQQHVSHARRLLHALAEHTRATAGHRRLPPSPSCAELYLSGEGCGVLMCVRGEAESPAALLPALLDAIPAALLAPMGMALEHADCRADAQRIRPDTAASVPSPPAAAPAAPSLSPLPLADAAPQAALRFQLDVMAAEVATEVATSRDLPLEAWLGAGVHAALARLGRGVAALRAHGFGFGLLEVDAALLSATALADGGGGEGAGEGSRPCEVRASGVRLSSALVVHWVGSSAADPPPSGAAGVAGQEQERRLLEEVGVSIAASP